RPLRVFEQVVEERQTRRVRVKLRHLDGPIGNALGRHEQVYREGTPSNLETRRWRRATESRHLVEPEAGLPEECEEPALGERRYLDSPGASDVDVRGPKRRHTVAKVVH